MRKVIFPIHVKLNAFIIFVLTMSLAFYVYYAINLFENDKLAYVYDTSRGHTKSLADNTVAKLDILKHILISTQSFKANDKAMQDLLKQYKDIFAYFQFENKKMIISYLANKDINFDILNLLDQPMGAKNIFQLGFLNPDIMYFKTHKHNNISFLLFDKSFFEEIVPKDKIFTNLIFFFNQDQLNLLAGVKLEGEQKTSMSSLFNNKINELGVDVASSSLNIETIPYIFSFEKIQGLDVAVISLVEESKAMEASEMLKHKSLYFGIFVLALTILLVLFFSRILTTPIHRLYVASQKFAQRDFSFRAELTNRDELGVLGDAINQMASDIGQYMNEMKEKHRLEAEVQTAKLVQSAFFPVTDVDGKWFELSAHYAPASECGGDWWGHYINEDKAVLMMIDATGHGTGPALITAVIHNSLTSIDYMSKMDPDFLQSAGRVMQFLNQSVCNVKSSIMATAFVAILDKKRMEMIYCNASHNPPIFWEKGQTSKDQLVVLNEKMGQRLGEDADAVYADCILSLKPNSRILFYTDGLVEAENAEKKTFGKRRLLKLIENFGDKNAKEIVDQTKGEYLNYIQDNPAGDDITFFCVSFELPPIPIDVIGLDFNHLNQAFPARFKLGTAMDKSRALIYEGQIDHVFAQIRSDASYQDILPARSLKPLQLNQSSYQCVVKHSFSNETVSVVSESIREKLSQVDLIGHFSDVTHYITLIATELVQNALIYQNENKVVSPVELKIKLAEDALMIEVKDLRGALTREDVIKKLKRAFVEKSVEEKITGAGLGLSMVVRSVDKLALMVIPGKETKISCVIQKYKRLKDFKEKQVSIHFDIRGA